MKTKKRRIAIQDDEGKHLRAIYVAPETFEFDDADISGLIAYGICNLKGKSFRRAILYWSFLADADLSNCNFEDADFCGSNLKNASFKDANMARAKLCLDNLGGSTRLQGADFTGAILDGADLTGAEYDEHTKFPSGFVPDRAGCVFVSESQRAKRR